MALWEPTLTHTLTLLPRPRLAVRHQRAGRGHAHRRQQVPGGVNERRCGEGVLQRKARSAQRRRRQVRPVRAPQRRLLVRPPRKLRLQNWCTRCFWVHAAQSRLRLTSGSRVTIRADVSDGQGLKFRVRLSTWMPTPFAMVTASGWNGTSASDMRECCGTLGYTMRDSAAADMAITCARPAVSTALAQALTPAHADAATGCPRGLSHNSKATARCGCRPGLLGWFIHA